MKVALYYNSHKIRVVTAYLYAEYPTSIPKQSILQDARKCPRTEAGYSWDAIEISTQINSILSNMAYKNNFLELPEVEEIFEKYSEKARLVGISKPN
ncbi:MAG: hypothetical protein ACHQ1H_08650 [Nitrososphaerales archaeon]